MFDRKYNNTFSANLTSHEHRAPTDESVRLLMEMEKAAQDKVLQQVRLQNCVLDAVLQKIETPMEKTILYRVAMKINGKHVVAEYVHTPLEGKYENTSSLTQNLSAEIAKVLTGQVLMAAIDSMVMRSNPYQPL